MKNKLSTWAALIILALLIIWPIWKYGRERLEVIIFLAVMAPVYVVIWKLWAEKPVRE